MRTDLNDRPGKRAERRPLESWRDIHEQLSGFGRLLASSPAAG
jgi:hypothetical protein